MSIDRADALAALGDPATEAERLAEIAYAHPDLGARIAAHPNVYPDLVAWLTEYGTVDDEAGADSADEEAPPPPPEDDDAPPPPPDDDAPPPPPAADDPAGDAPPPPPAEEPATPPSAPRRSRRLLLIIGIAAAVVLALGATGIVVVQQTVLSGASTSAGGQISCPDGARAVMWSDWDGGATLVCEFDGGGHVMIMGRDGSVQRSDDVTVTPAGYRSPLGEVAFGGWAVWPGGGDGFLVGSGGDAEYGESTGLDRAADGIPPCPSGSFPLSLSVWEGGWLLICGTTEGDPSDFTYEADGERGSGGAMVFDEGELCGDATSGAVVCVSTAPALVQVFDAGATARYTVGSNYFAETGFGGAGQGTGAYGVEAPDDSAEEQVGYLVAILEKSRAARSTVSGVLAPLNACSVSSGDVQNIRTLHQARTDLLVALRTTPIERVPDGTRLLGMLTEAISLSEQAIVGYIATGEQMAGGDCAGGRATYRNAIAIAEQAEASKQRFVDAWNAQIVPQFGVPAYTARDI